MCRMEQTSLFAISAILSLPVTIGRLPKASLTGVTLCGALGIGELCFTDSTLQWC